ncbi:MAG: twin transmembrane helix small protein [Planktomarina sp.]
MLDNPLFIPTALACASVLIIMVIGIAGFGQGGDFARKHSNKIMRMRIAAQFVAVIMIVAFVYVGRQ